MRTLPVAVAALCCCRAVAAQPQPNGVPTAPAAPPGIQDNSFLLEEAYNQEPGVVQHINLFRRNVQTGEWLAAFTQEYPVPGITHQLSYTVPYQRAGEAGTFSGLGDIALNYRYQLIGNGESRVAATPRLTVFLPTGNARRGLGAGSTGVQLGLAVSVLAARDWVTHGNVGVTFTPSARDSRGEKADTVGGYAGASVIWLGPGRWNGMLEFLWSRDQIVAGPGRTRAESSLTLSPGLRWAFDFRSGLQIVPGVGVPIGLGPSRGQYGVLLYLSFEHPMWSAPAR